MLFIFIAFSSYFNALTIRNLHYQEKIKLYLLSQTQKQIKKIAMKIHKYTLHAPPNFAKSKKTQYTPSSRRISAFILLRFSLPLFFTFPAAAPIKAAAQNAQNTQACGNTEAGFDAWKKTFARRAETNGIGRSALAAFGAAHYAHATIAADRNQKIFKLSLEQFMRKRGAETIISRGRILKQQNAALLAELGQSYGVPAGILLAIWGLETGFGSQMGKQNTLSAIATLAYDCRRAAFFTEQLLAALTLIDNGLLNSRATGAMHGEIGQTQFLPLNALRYGADGSGDGKIDLIGSHADALASTANFLRAHGWKRGQSYQEGQPNFTAIEGWNKAKVYQRAIAAIAVQIDK